jgi:hypothetical protein
VFLLSVENLMPFCRSCSEFFPTVNSNRLCSLCAKKFHNGELSEKLFRTQQKDLEKSMNINLVLQPYASAIENYQNGGNTINAQPRTRQVYVSPFRRILTERQVFEGNSRRIPVALSNMLLGLVFLLFEEYAFFGLIPITSGLFIAIRAWRIEGRNWRLFLIFGLAAVFYIIILIQLISILNG